MTTVATSRYAEAHANQQGPGDARPTALQIIKDEQREGDMNDKVVLITGCSSGLGVETARAMKATGATLYLTARNLEKAKQALGDILTGDRVHLLKLDLESFDSVRSCVNEFKSKSGTLNILIENAGIRHVPFGRTQDGYEKHWGTNHLSHFLLFELLRPMLLASSSPNFYSRVIIVSSTAHRNAPMEFGDLNWEKRKYDRSIAYGQSKIANVYTASEIERRYGAQGLHAWSVHPGGIRTGLQASSQWDIKDWMVVFKSGPMATLNTMMNTEQGASTSVWAAVSRELEGQGGKYLERNRFSEPLKKGWKLIDPGHAEWTYDTTAAARLYDVSLKEIGA
jgi:NAD(P)-dependent dehydrogenase (short-subunit alcohol dehydrogenase family)